MEIDKPPSLRLESRFRGNDIPVRRMNQPSDMPPAGIQFSIRHVLFATAVIAAALAALSSRPTASSCLVLMILDVVFTTVAIIASVRTTRMVRSFWIGFAVPIGFAGAGSLAAPAMFQFAYAIRIEEYIRFVNGACWCLAPINGLIAAGVHWLLWPPKSRH